MQDLLSQNLKPKLFPDILESALDPLCMEIDRWKPIDTLQIGIHGAHRTTCWQADPDADRRATFRQSLSVLKRAKQEGVRVTKTSIMLGVGETEDQFMDALKELRKVDVDVVTFGQYMRPTKKHMKVDRYVEPAEFDCWKKLQGIWTCRWRAGH